MGDRVVDDWWTPLHEIVARRSPLAILPLPVRILGALLLVTGFVVGAFAFVNLAVGVYTGREAFLAEGIVYSILTALLGLAGGGILLSQFWGWWLATLASFAAVAHEAFRLSQSPPLGLFWNQPGWLASVGVNWSISILNAVVLVLSIVAFRYFRRPVASARST